MQLTSPAMKGILRGGSLPPRAQENSGYGYTDEHRE